MRILNGHVNGSDEIQKDVHTSVLEIRFERYRVNNTIPLILKNTITRTGCRPLKGTVFQKQYVSGGIGRWRFTEHDVSVFSVNSTFD